MGQCKMPIHYVDGTQCADSCPLMSNPDNGSFVPDTLSIWILQ